MNKNKKINKLQLRISEQDTLLSKITINKEQNDSIIKILVIYSIFSNTILFVILFTKIRIYLERVWFY